MNNIYDKFFNCCKPHSKTVNNKYENFYLQSLCHHILFLHDLN